jgi:hypothetical protein
METKVKTTISLEKSILKTIKQIALNKDTTQTEIINNYLRECIEKEPIENKTEIKWIKKPDPSKNMEDLKGIIKTDKPVNAVKLINEVRKGE